MPDDWLDRVIDEGEGFWLQYRGDRTPMEQYECLQNCMMRHHSLQQALFGGEELLDFVPPFAPAKTYMHNDLSVVPPLDFMDRMDSIPVIYNLDDMSFDVENMNMAQRQQQQALDLTIPDFQMPYEFTSQQPLALQEHMWSNTKSSYDTVNSEQQPVHTWVQSPYFYGALQRQRAMPYPLCKVTAPISSSAGQMLPSPPHCHFTEPWTTEPARFPAQTRAPEISSFLQPCLLQYSGIDGGLNVEKKKRRRKKKKGFAIESMEKMKGLRKTLEQGEMMQIENDYLTGREMAWYDTEMALDRTQEFVESLDFAREMEGEL